GNQVVNRDGVASSLILYCAPSVKTFSLSGNAGLTGVVYAPFANLKFNGGGSDTLDFVGALVVNSITLNGHFNVHYDECLNDQAANSLFVVKSWDEIY
ncbi:MAG TPA: collagen-binding domain-containing protein, partial [Verrucomicrobiae bacterium]